MTHYEDRPHRNPHPPKSPMTIEDAFPLSPSMRLLLHIMDIQEEMLEEIKGLRADIAGKKKSTK